MSAFLLIIAVLLAVAYFSLLASHKSASLEGEWPFDPKNPLSGPEQILHERLGKALPEHIVLAQVGLPCILGVRKGRNTQAWYDLINALSADFVVFSRDSGIVAVVELEDASHGSADRKAADAKKDKALASAGIPILRWQAEAMPNEASIRATFMQRNLVTGKSSRLSRQAAARASIGGDSSVTLVDNEHQRIRRNYGTTQTAGQIFGAPSH